MEYQDDVCFTLFPVSGVCDQLCRGYITMGRFPHHGRTSSFLSPFHSKPSRWTYLAPASWWVAGGQLPRKTSTPWSKGWWNRTCWGSWSGIAVFRMVSSTRPTGTVATGVKESFPWLPFAATGVKEHFQLMPFLCSEESQEAFKIALNSINGSWLFCIWSCTAELWGDAPGNTHISCFPVENKDTKT